MPPPRPATEARSGSLEPGRPSRARSANTRHPPGGPHTPPADRMYATDVRQHHRLMPPMGGGIITNRQCSKRYVGCRRSTNCPRLLWKDGAWPLTNRLLSHWCCFFIGPFNVTKSLMWPRVKLHFSGARQQFWRDALPDA